ncbi:hypothetical protein WS61_03705 [Burkholderia sp. ABCPW 11]|nr:hypothetical protein WS61_03705 [Burkholderia sp. ABCPW 11]
MFVFMRKNVALREFEQIDAGADLRNHFINHLPPLELELSIESIFEFNIFSILFQYFSPGR